MSLWVIFLLALVQGLTEFLPISSSAHLILVGQWVDANQGLAFDVAAHLGTLLAVCWYFRRELAAFARGAVTGEPRRERRLGWQVALATLPAAVCGLIFHDWVEGALRSTLVIAATTIGFGILLGFADRGTIGTRDEYQLSWREVMLVGLAQALALIPGTSRSGITITAALFLGLSRRGAARFSFLLAIPILALAGSYGAWQVAAHEAAIHWREFGLSVALSALSALACIHLFLGVIERVGMWPFVAYRLALGAVLLFLTL